MSDEVVQRAVREVERHGQVMPMVDKLLEGLTSEQLAEFSKGLAAKFSKQLPWLDDIESYFFEVTIKDCECAERDEDGELIYTKNGCSYSNRDNCNLCDGNGQIFQDSEFFEEAVKATGGLAVNIAWETLQAENDMMMTRAWEALDSKPLFVRHLEIDHQFLKYLVIYPAPDQTK